MPMQQQATACVLMQSDLTIKLFFRSKCLKAGDQFLESNLSNSENLIGYQLFLMGVPLHMWQTCHNVLNKLF